MRGEELLQDNVVVLLLVIEIAISESKNLVFKNLKLFKQK